MQIIKLLAIRIDPKHRLIKIRWLVIHELVEISEIRKMGIRITKDIFMRHNDRTELAHFRAAQVEFEIARAAGNYNHIKNRYKDLRNWCTGQSVAPKKKKEYEKMVLKVERMLKDAHD